MSLGKEGRPDWIKVRAYADGDLDRLRMATRHHKVNTICDSAQCPNIGDCWRRGELTVMIMGDTCTRHCRFCAVRCGSPEALDDGEPFRVAQLVKDLELRHVVITSVTRDDIYHGGAEHIADVVRTCRWHNPNVSIEVLVPDMCADEGAIALVMDAAPNVFGHNIEVVESLQGLRDRRASFRRSLEVLRKAKDMDPRTMTKSSLMVGLGESRDEIHDTLDSLKNARVDIVTIGQYLRPKGSDLRVARYYSPEEFEEMGDMAREIGFKSVVAGPFVRSSYKAGISLEESRGHVDR